MSGSEYLLPYRLATLDPTLSAPYDVYRPPIYSLFIALHSVSVTGYTGSSGSRDIIATSLKTLDYAPTTVSGIRLLLSICKAHVWLRESCCVELSIQMLYGRPWVAFATTTCGPFFFKARLPTFNNRLAQ